MRTKKNSLGRTTKQSEKYGKTDEAKRNRPLGKVEKVTNMKNEKKKFALIFDLDGTLWDGVDTVVEAWNQGFTQLGRSQRVSRESLEPTMGLPIDGFRQLFFSDLPEEEGARALDVLMQLEGPLVEKKGGILFQGVAETIPQLAELADLAIVSNCGLGYIEAFIRHYQLEDYFVDHESNGGTGLSKGENIQLICQRNGFELAWYIGDTLGDAKAAAFANTPFVFAAYGFGQVPEAQCLATLNSFDELFPLVKAQRHGSDF